MVPPALIDRKLNVSRLSPKAWAPGGESAHHSETEAVRARPVFCSSGFLIFFLFLTSVLHVILPMNHIIASGGAAAGCWLSNCHPAGTALSLEEGPGLMCSEHNAGQGDIPDCSVSVLHPCYLYSPFFCLLFKNVRFSSQSIDFKKK